MLTNYSDLKLKCQVNKPPNHSTLPSQRISNTSHVNINPLLPIAHKSAQIDKISILKLEGIIKKISYERRDYESVDEKSLSKAMSRKTMKKRIQALKG